MESPCSLDAQPWQRPRPDAPSGAPGAGGCPGLVTFKTSDTPSITEVEIDQVESRRRRLRRSVTLAARLFTQALSPRRFKPAMLTLTYRDVDGFEPRHISALLNRMRSWIKRRKGLLRYVWVAELQKRGALHYHVLLWLPKGLTLPKPDKQGWWPHGSTRIEWARNPVGYLCKYVSKFDELTHMPKGARLHGAGGFDADGREIRRWFNLPAWLRALVGVQRRFVRVKGVGLVERSSGLCVPSPWRVSFSGGRVVATRLFTYPEAFDESPGPYSEVSFA